MHAVNIKKPEKLFTFGHTIIKFPAYFYRTISGQKRGPVLTNKKSINLVKDSQQNIWIPSRNNFSQLKILQQFMGKTGIKCCPIKKLTTRSMLNIWIPSLTHQTTTF